MVRVVTSVTLSKYYQSYNMALLEGFSLPPLLRRKQRPEQVSEIPADIAMQTLPWKHPTAGPPKVYTHEERDAALRSSLLKNPRCDRGSTAHQI